jgi:hypothetical protein
MLLAFQLLFIIREFRITSSLIRDPLLPSGMMIHEKVNLRGCRMFGTVRLPEFNLRLVPLPFGFYWDIFSAASEVCFLELYGIPSLPNVSDKSNQTCKLDRHNTTANLERGLSGECESFNIKLVTDCLQS